MSRASDFKQRLRDAVADLAKAIDRGEVNLSMPSRAERDEYDALALLCENFDLTQEAARIRQWFTS